MQEQTLPAPRVAVVTGASSGIGLAAAKALACEGWRIIGTGRDEGRTVQAEGQLRSLVRPGARIDLLRVDLSLLREAATLAQRIAALTDRVDVLLNNAGGAAKERMITSEGNEGTFAGNHLGHFVLTQRLLPLLRRAASAAPWGATRIINVSSSAHQFAPGFDWSDVQMLRHFAPMPAYCNAKLANLLFTRALAERLAGDGIVVHAMHPGAVNSNFIHHADEDTQRYLRGLDLISPEEAADTLVWLATAPEPGGITGAYYHERRRIDTSAAASDADAAQRLWAYSESAMRRAIPEEA